MKLLSRKPSPLPQGMKIKVHVFRKNDLITLSDPEFIISGGDTGSGGVVFDFNYPYISNGVRANQNMAYDSFVMCGGCDPIMGHECYREPGHEGLCWSQPKGVDFAGASINIDPYTDILIDAPSDEVYWDAAGEWADAAYEKLRKNDIYIAFLRPYEREGVILKSMAVSTVVDRDQNLIEWLISMPDEAGSKELFNA